eukprot:2014677-Pyramimonas_sp.AAC.1
MRPEALFLDSEHSRAWKELYVPGSDEVDGRKRCCCRGPAPVLARSGTTMKNKKSMLPGGGPPLGLLCFSSTDFS